MNNSEEDKDAYWENINMLLWSGPDDEHLLIGRDLNGHVGSLRHGYVTHQSGQGLRTPDIGLYNRPKSHCHQYFIQEANFTPGTVYK